MSKAKYNNKNYLQKIKKNVQLLFGIAFALIFSVKVFGLDYIFSSICLINLLIFLILFICTLIRVSYVCGVEEEGDNSCHDWDFERSFLNNINSKIITEKFSVVA